jgi:S-adenosylmethionine-diacylglycerol 3-amino-3-carboxypropyl transferase
MSILSNKIYYSSVNEDSTSEFQALEIKSDDRVLCITGSGARPLDLLVKSLGELVSIDCNPVQNFLLELKLAALKYFEYNEFLSFLGITDGMDRQAAYYKIRYTLSTEARQYWDRQEWDIHQGIFYRGSWEKYFRLLGLYLKSARGRVLSQLFSCTTIEEQQQLWNTEWNNRAWRTFLRSVSIRFVWKYFLRDPGFYLYVPDEYSIYRYLLERLNQASRYILFKVSPFARILFNGKLSENGALPPHLQRQHYASIQSQTDRVIIKTVPLDSIADGGKAGIFNAFSLSDLSSYTSVQEYRECWNAIRNVSTTGARICERQFLVKRELPGHGEELFVRNAELEHKLSIGDNSIFYTFICASLV